MELGSNIIQQIQAAQDTNFCATFNEIDQCLSKLISLLTLLPETECKSTKETIINKINNVTGIKHLSLLEAVETNNINAVKEVLTRNNNLEVKDDLRNTALHISSQIGNEDIVKFLLERGADMKAKNNELRTPLHAACRSINENIVAIFLEIDSIINIRDKYGNTPLHLASEYNKGEAVKKLLNHGADYSIRNNDKKIPSELSNCADSIKAFFDFDPNVLSDQQKRILLVYASKMNWLETIENLIKSKIDVNCIYYNVTPLMNAALYEHDRVIEKLLSNGADVNIKDSFDKTALHYACLGENLESVKLLIQYDSNLEAVARLGTPIEYALNKDRHLIVKYFLELQKGYDVTDVESLFQKCIYFDSLKTAEVLLDGGLAIDAINNRNETLLFAACRNGSEVIVNLLLKRGADINSRGYLLNTPLQYACLYNYIDIVKLLLLNKPDVTCKNKNNETALDIAREKHYEELVTILENYSPKSCMS